MSSLSATLNILLLALWTVSWVFFCYESIEILTRDHTNHDKFNNFIYIIWSCGFRSKYHATNSSRKIFAFKIHYILFSLVNRNGVRFTTITIFRNIYEDTLVNFFNELFLFFMLQSSWIIRIDDELSISVKLETQQEKIWTLASNEK